jgi:aminoglycoside 6'-N-acetyltransferase I
MDIRIKRIGKVDAYILGHVAEDVFDHEVTAERLASYLDEPNHILCVAVVDGLVVGQARAVVHSHPDKSPELYIDNAGVASAFQRKGIATQMLAEIIQFGKERGCREVWVGTESDNESAKALYHSLGLKMQTVAMFEGKL